MYARVAVFEGASPENIEHNIGVIREAEGPPPGVPGSRIIALGDKRNGTLIMIGFFDSEDDLRQADATLNDMAPERPMGERSAVHLCEVLLERTAPSA